MNQTFLFIILFGQVVFASFYQNIRKQFPRVHPYEPTNQTNTHPTVIQQITTSHTKLSSLPDDVLRLISNNLDTKSNLKLGASGVLFKNITKEKNAQSNKNLKTLKIDCGDAIYWSLIQNGHSIFRNQDTDRWRSIEEHERCIRAIILNHQNIKSMLKHLSIVHPRGNPSIDSTLSYFNALETLFNKTDQLESITFKSGETSSNINPHLDVEFFRIASIVNVNSVIFETYTENDNVLSQFMRDSKLRCMTLWSLERNEASQLRHLRNLESLTLREQVYPIDFSTLTHLRHVSMNDYGMQVESLFAGINNITSIHATLRIKNELELRLRNTTKRITSLTFYNKKEISAKERTLSFNLLTNFIATLKHITIHMKVDYNGFDRFFKNTKQLESITVRTAIPIKILKYAQGIKHFKLYNDAQLPHIDRNVIQFIKQQNKLQSLSIIISPLRRIDASMFLAYLDRIIDAILVRRTVTQLILIVEVEVKLKDEFSQSFYKSLVKLENLDLNLNGIPIRNVLRDLSVIDDSMFQLVSSDSRNFVLKLTARSLTNIY